MIDWLTLKLDISYLSDFDRERFWTLTNRITCTDPDGAVIWDIPARQSVRSDSHQVTISYGCDVTICGSPTRAMGSWNNVFGSCDIIACALAMISCAERATGLTFFDDNLDIDGNLSRWRCTRIDITHNYLLGDPAEVRQCLMYLRHAEGGRYQLRTTSDTVYYSSNSTLRRGKIYHKGPHLRYQSARGQARTNDHEISVADRILRLELTCASEWMRRYRKTGGQWWTLTEQDLDDWHNAYFSALVGNSVEVSEMDNLLVQFEQYAKTKGQALAAYRTWSLIKSIGVFEAQASMPLSTWMRHRKIMFDAGLTWADLQASNIVPIRRRVIDLGAPVRSWAECGLVA